MPKYALIIGIENYPSDSGQEKVKFAKNDAAEMALYARSAGFQLIGEDPILDHKATYSHVIESLDSMFNYVQTDDFVLIYYAGHGYYSEYGGYLIPYDYNSNNEKNESTCISFDSINKRLRSKKPAKFVFFLDTCHSGFAGKQIDIRSGLSPGYQKPAKKAQKKVRVQINSMVRGPKRGYSTGRVVFTSSSPHEPSVSIDEFKHGLFTYYLLQYLKRKSHQPEVNIEELILFVKKAVLSYSIKHHLKQTPVAYTNIQGEFNIPTYQPSDHDGVVWEDPVFTKSRWRPQPDSADKSNKPSWLIVGILLFLIGVFSIVTGTYVQMKKFTTSSYLNFAIHLFENYLPKEKHSVYSWGVKVNANLMRSGHIRIAIAISRDWGPFQPDVTGTFPQGFLVNLTHRYTYESSTANLIHRRKETIPVPDQPGLMTTRIADETPIELPMHINVEEKLEGMFGPAYFFHLAELKNLTPPADTMNEYSLRVLLTFVLKEPLDDYNYLTGGLVRVHVHGTVGEYEYERIGKKKWDRLTIAERYLFETKRKEQDIISEFFWAPKVQGKFTVPQDMVGAKQFYETVRNDEVIKGDFVYEVSAANWLSFLGVIFWLPLCGSGGYLIRKYLKQKAKNSSGSN